jgi:hypothetical protein
VTGADHSRRAVVGLRRATASGLLVLTVVTGVLILADVQTPARLFVTLAFVLLAPGWAIAAFVRPARPSLTWSVAVAVGISVSIVIAQLMVNLHQWTPTPAMLALTGGTAPLLLHHLLRDSRWDAAPARQSSAPANSAPANSVPANSARTTSRDRAQSGPAETRLTETEAR